MVKFCGCQNIPLNSHVNSHVNSGKNQPELGESGLTNRGNFIELLNH